MICIIYIYIYILHFPLEKGWHMGLKLMQIDQTNFTDRMSFLPSSLIQEISPVPETLSTNT